MDKLLAIKNRLNANDGLLAIVIVVIFICLTLFLGYYSNLVIPGNPDPSARYLLEPATHLDFMSEWDGPHYISIAKYGYTNNALTAFFPLYPLLIRLVMYVVRSPLISALFVSWACLVGAIYFYLKILKEIISKNKIEHIMGVLLFLLFPTAVFLAATYTESLYALATLGALYFGLKGKYIYAGLFTALATATHPTGVFDIALIAFLLYENKKKIWQIVSSMAIGCAGIVAYISYLWYSKGKPLDFVSAQKHNHWLSGQYINTIINSITPIDLLLFALTIGAVIYWWNKKRSFSLYSLLYIILPLAGGNVSGYSRYALMAFPIQFMLLNKFKNSRLAYPVILIFSTVLWSYFVIHYAAGYTGGS